MHLYFYSQTSVALEVLAVLVEEKIPAAGPKSVHGIWLLWPPGALPWHPAFEYQHEQIKM